MKNDLKQVEGTGAMDSFDHNSPNEIVSKVTARIATAKSFLLMSVIANMGIIFIFERSIWAAAAALITTVAGVVVFGIITDSADRARAAIVILLDLVSNGISKTSDLQAQANKNNTTLSGKLSSNATIDVDADENHFLRFDIAINNADCDQIIGATYPCGNLMANLLKTKLHTGTQVSLNGNFVGRIHDDDPERRLRMKYIVSSVKWSPESIQ